MNETQQAGQLSKEPITYGQVAYEAYCATSKGKSLVSGAALPAWGGLTEEIKRAWVAAGSAAADLVWADATGSWASS